MENFFMYNSIRKTVIQFLDLFNGIQIVKFDDNGDFIKYVKVNLKLANKQKFYYWLNDRKHGPRMPAIGCFIDSISPATTSRGSNKQIKFKSNSGIIGNFIPYDINFRLSIATLYMKESDQILEQIIPYFNSYTMARVNIPEVDSYFDIKVILNGITPELDTDMSDDDIRTSKWDLDFTVHSYVIKPISTTNDIHNIYLELKNYDFFETPSLSGDGLFETLHTSGYRDESATIITDYEILGDN